MFIGICIVSLCFAVEHYRVHLLPSQQVPLGTRKLEAKSQQQFISWCVLDCKYIRKVQWCVLSVHFIWWLKMASRELSFWPPPLIFLRTVRFTPFSRELYLSLLFFFKIILLSRGKVISSERNAFKMLQELIRICLALFPWLIIVRYPDKKEK